MTTQQTLWNGEERVETVETILKRGMHRVASEGVTKQQYNKVVVWLSMLEYPSLWQFFEFAANAKRHCKGDEWKNMVRDYLFTEAKDINLPCSETLDRTLRRIKQKQPQTVQYTQDARLARTL